jgi:hypothetical protein
VKLALAILVAAAAAASARVGETKAEIEARYGVSQVEGPKVAPAQQCLVYRKNGFVIGVQFLDGVSACEHVVRPDPTDDRGAVLSAEEVAAFLDANKGGSTWPATVGRRVRADGKLVAEISERMMAIAAAAFAEARDMAATAARPQP